MRSQVVVSGVFMALMLGVESGPKTVGIMRYGWTDITELVLIAVLLALAMLAKSLS